MGIFGGIFGKGDSNSEKNKSEIPWIMLSSLDQLDEIIEVVQETKIDGIISSFCGFSGY